MTFNDGIDMHLNSGFFIMASMMVCWLVIPVILLHNHYTKKD